MYDGTWETPGGASQEEDVSLLATALREAWEECGLNQKQVRIRETLCNRESMLPGERVITIQPFATSFQEEGPHPWVTWFFLGEVSPQWQPQSHDRKAGDFRWAAPQQLLEEIFNEPNNFFGHQRQVIVRLAGALVRGKIKSLPV